MVWPTTPIPTANLDASTDSPAASRADLLQLAQQVNQMREHMTPSAFAVTLVDDQDAAAARATLGAASIGTAETITGVKTFSQPVLLGNGGAKFASDGAQDTGIEWVSDGVFRATCNAQPALDISSTSILSRGPVLGYGPGAGGSVQQTGPITSTVTLNARSGQITTVTDTIGNGLTIIFGLTNSLATFEDLMIANLVGHPDSGSGLWLRYYRSTDGRWRFVLRNDSGISLTGPWVIRFALIRTSTS